MAKKTPVRQCVGCGERKAKQDLIRIVYNKKTGEINLDEKGKLPGRGAYICPERKCLKKARKKNSFARSLKTSVSDEIYHKLMEEIDIMKG